MTLNIGVISRYLATLTAPALTNQNEVGHSGEHDPRAPAVSPIISGVTRSQLRSVFTNE